MKDIDVMQRQLDRVLGFFPRVETRINTLFGVNTLILIIGALNLSPILGCSAAIRPLNILQGILRDCLESIELRFHQITRG